MMSPDLLRSRIESILQSAGEPVPILSIEPCTTGGNNRTYKVSAERGTYLAKEYFRDALDKRDRLAAEWAFLSYARNATPNFTPLPIARDEAGGVAIFEFLEGTSFRAGQLGWPEINAATGFFTGLNAPESRNRARTLPLASEACFSLSEHIDLIGARVGVVADSIRAADSTPDAIEFANTLARYWTEFSAAFPGSAAAMGLDYRAPLEPAQRCVSPSDFGFHNALLVPDGAIRFIDFEYAGWDDPAKTAADFFTQLAVPVPGVFFEPVVAAFMASFPSPEELVIRARLLRPAYVVKWCCIALNIFVPAQRDRRTFANPALDVDASRAMQLQKARSLFRTIHPDMN